MDKTTRGTRLGSCENVPRSTDSEDPLARDLNPPGPIRLGQYARLCNRFVASDCLKMCIAPVGWAGGICIAAGVSPVGYTILGAAITVCTVSTMASAMHASAKQNATCTTVARDIGRSAALSTLGPFFLFFTRGCPKTPETPNSFSDSQHSYSELSMSEA